MFTFNIDARASQLTTIFRSVVGLKKEKRSRKLGQGELMTSQVKKILEQKGQGLILMARG